MSTPSWSSDLYNLVHDSMPRIPKELRSERPSGWSKSVKEEVWAKGDHVAGEDPNEIRRDSWGNMITKRTMAIDHHIPLAKGGVNNTSNLVPLHKDTNRAKSDHMPGPPKWATNMHGLFK